MALIRLLPSYRDCVTIQPLSLNRKRPLKSYIYRLGRVIDTAEFFAHANISAKSRPVALAQEQEAQMG